MTKYNKQNPDTIESMFDKIAGQYDVANGLMSLNMHKYWNSQLSKSILNVEDPKSYLDLCAGTGEIAFDLLKKMSFGCEAFLLDFSNEMLSCAKNKADKLPFSQHRIHYIHADAQQIPLPTDSIDAVTLAYGIRNVKNPQKCIGEVRRVLRKGGVFAILELTQPKNGLMKVGHKFYMKTFLPLIGKFIASEPEAYQYLCNSIQEFMLPEELESLLKQAGFQQTSIKSLSCGIATIVQGQKGE